MIVPTVNKVKKGRATGKHIHKYMHQQLKVIKVWRCAAPECSHWMPPHLEDLLMGRFSVCWNCNETFPLDERAMQDEQPVCINCIVPDMEEKLEENMTPQQKMIEVLKRMGQ